MAVQKEGRCYHRIRLATSVKITEITIEWYNICKTKRFTISSADRFGDFTVMKTEEDEVVKRQVNPISDIYGWDKPTYKIQIHMNDGNLDNKGMGVCYGIRRLYIEGEGAIDPSVIMKAGSLMLNKEGILPSIEVELPKASLIRSIVISGLDNVVCQKTKVIFSSGEEFLLSSTENSFHDVATTSIRLEVLTDDAETIGITVIGSSFSTKFLLCQRARSEYTRHGLGYVYGHIKEMISNAPYEE